MTEEKDIAKAIEQAVSETVKSRLTELRESLTAEVIAKVMESIQPLITQTSSEAQEDATSPGSGPTDLLNAAVATIYDTSAQAEILKSLLDGISQFSSRAVLFVTKGGNLSAWQARGFEKESAIKGFSLALTAGLAGRAIRDKEPVSAAASEFDGGFIATHGNPKDGNATVFPIVVRDRVAAVVYTDAGTDTNGTCDQSAVRILVRSAASWLELVATRKAGGEVPVAEMPPPPHPGPPEAETMPPNSAGQEPETIPAEVKAAPPAPPVAAPTPIAVAGADLSGLSQEDQEIHKKAKRFAKLLVDEIKLYNQAKVAEGRQNKDLYARLKEDIDKSRATYEKRYGNTAAGSAKYFNSEVVRILAENDASLLGGDFSQ